MQLTRLEVAAISLLAFAHAALAQRFWFVCDDAWISFRYAHNWAGGLGPRFNPGDQVPVEGYSNFGWMALGALVETLGGAIELWLPAASIAVSAGLLLWFYAAARRLELAAPVAWLSTLALALSPGFVIWSTSGLATIVAAAALFAVFDRLVLDYGRHPVAAALAGVVLALVRTEGIAWCLVVAVLAVVLAGAEREHRARLLRAVGIFLGTLVVVYGTYYTWRYLTYGTLVANTATAKVGLSTSRIERGVAYVVGFWLVAITPAVHLLAGLASWPVLRWRGLLVWAMAIGVPLYAVIVGGDFMTMGRMLVPGLPFAALLLGCVLQLLWARGPAVRVLATAAALGLSAVGAMPLDNQHLVPEDLREPYRVRFNTARFRSEYEQWKFMRSNGERWRNLGRALAQVTAPGESLVLGAIGAIGYHSDLYIFDRYGLVSPEVATRQGRDNVRRHSPGHDKEVGVGFFLDREPTYLRAELLVGARGLKRAEGEVRGWGVNRTMKADYAPDVRPAMLDGKQVYVLLLARQDEAETIWDTWTEELERLRNDPL